MHLQTANCGGKKLVKCTIPNIKCTSSKLNDNAAVYIKSCFFLLAYQCSRWFFCMTFDDFVEHMLEDINEPQLIKKKKQKNHHVTFYSVSTSQSVQTVSFFLRTSSFVWTETLKSDNRKTSYASVKARWEEAFCLLVCFIQNLQSKK